MKLRLLFSLLIFSSFNALALGPLPPELEKANLDFVKQIFDSSTHAAQASDFEPYKNFSPDNKHLGEPPTFVNKLSYAMDREYPVETLYRDICYLSPKTDPPSWRATRIFRMSPNQDHLKEWLGQFKLNPPQQDILFAGAWVPEPDRFIRVIPQVFVPEFESNQLVLNVLKNPYGIYSDFGAPVQFKFRKYKDILVGQVTSEKNEDQYEICFQRPVSYCYAYASTSNNQTKDLPLAELHYDSEYVNVVGVADTEKQAREAVKNYFEKELKWAQGARSENLLKWATLKAKLTMHCSTDYKKLNLKRAQLSDYGSIHWAPLNEL